MRKPAYTYAELDEIFRGDGRNDYIGISLIDGLIAALVAGPVFVPPQEWLPLMFGGRLPLVDETPIECRAVNTIFNRYNEVSSALAENPSSYRPIFMIDGDRMIVSHWAVGFIRAIGQRVEAWTALLLTDMRKTLAPIFASHELGSPFLLDLPNAEKERLRAGAHHQIANAVIALRQACTAQHAETLPPPRRRRQSLRSRKI